mgnify:CR=1 FL=1
MRPRCGSRDGENSEVIGRVTRGLLPVIVVDDASSEYMEATLAIEAL